MQRMGPCSKQPDRSNGHQQEKGIVTPGLKPGATPLDATPQRVPEESWQQAPPIPTHPYQCHILCRWSYWPTPSPCTLPTCTAQARAQGFPHTRPPLPKALPGLCFFYRFEGGLQGGEPDNKEIGSQSALRWDVFSHKDILAFPACCTLLFLPLSLFPTRECFLGCLILIHLGLIIQLQVEASFLQLLAKSGLSQL